MTLTAERVLQNGKYKIEGQLGVGFLGTTYRAQTLEGQTVVIKTFNENWQNHPGYRGIQSQFVEDLQRLIPCHHRHLVKILDTFVERGQVFWVMEYIFGQTLAEIVEAGEPISDRQATEYIRQVTSGLQALHQRGVLHGNVSPWNIIRPFGTHELILMDIGLTNQLTPGTSLSPHYLSTGYRALEQYLVGQHSTPLTDIYGLATSFYYLLTGQVPTTPPLRIRQTVPQIIYLRLPDIRQFRPNVNPHLEEAIHQGMEVEAELRPPSVSKWLELLPLYVTPSYPESHSLRPSHVTHGQNPETFPLHSQSALPKFPLFCLFLATSAVFGWIGFDITYQSVVNGREQIVSHRVSHSHEELFEEWLDREREKPSPRPFFADPSISPSPTESGGVSEETETQEKDVTVEVSPSPIPDSQTLSQDSQEKYPLRETEGKTEKSNVSYPQESPQSASANPSTPSLPLPLEPVPAVSSSLSPPEENPKTASPPPEVISSPSPSPEAVEVPTLPELPQTDLSSSSEKVEENSTHSSKSTPDLYFPDETPSSSPLLN